uniref:Uncharacterized protein n=1 Tax=Romanomermis culicivorax TaxID=13658 RepID=A0A915J3G5_ROMCU
MRTLQDRNPRYHIVPLCSRSAERELLFSISIGPVTPVTIKLFSACKVTIYKQLTEYLISASENKQKNTFRYKMLENAANL